MDGSEDKAVSLSNDLGSSSTVTITEPVASGSEKPPVAELATGEVEGNREGESESVKTSAEKVAVEEGGGSCSEVDKEVGGSGLGVRHSDGGVGETLQKKVVLVFDGREVDLERAAEDAVDDIPVGEIQDSTVQSSGVAEGSSKEEQREELKFEDLGGKDGGVSCSDGKDDDDRASPDGGVDKNPSTEVRISGEIFSSVDKRSTDGDVAEEGETKVTGGSNDAETCVVQGSADASEGGEVQISRVSVDGDTQLLDNSVDGDAQVNDLSSCGETQAVQRSLDQDSHVIRDSDNENMDGSRDVGTQVTDGTKVREPLFAQVSVDGDNPPLEISRDGGSQYNDFSEDGGTQAIQSSADQVMQVVEDPGKEDRDGSRVFDGQVNVVISDGETRVTQGSLNEDTRIVEDTDMVAVDDTDTQDLDGSRDGESRVIQGSMDEDIYRDVETEVPNDSSGGETQVVPGSVDEDTQFVDGKPQVSKDEDMEGGLTKKDTVVPMEDLISQEVGPLENDPKDLDMRSGFGGTSGVENIFFAATGKVELAEESEGHPMKTVEVEEDAAQDSEPDESALLGDEVFNNENEAASRPESTVLEDLGQQSQVLEEAPVFMVSAGGSTPPLEATGSDSLEKAPTSVALEGMLSSAANDTVQMVENEIDNVTSETMDEEGQDPVEGKMASVDEEITCANIEGMDADADAYNENVCFSVEELQASGEMVNGSTEHHYHAIADPPSFSQPTDVFIGGEAAYPLENKKQQGITVPDQLVVKAESGKDSVVNGNSHQSPDSASSFRSTRAVAGDDVAEMDTFVHLDATLCPAGDNQNLNPETAGVGLEINCEAASIQSNVLASNVDTTDEKSLKWASLHRGSLGSAHQASYQLPSDHEGEFHVSDLVWGKVRSHPWWPGQIFDPSDASEQALKYQKKDRLLVAYFGDRTFAWNEAPLLKHFRSHFRQVEKQSNSESFQNAVGCALEEFSRRVELGLTCSCVPEEDADRIKFQLFDNSGIQQEACKRGDFLGKSGSADLFEPVKLVNYVKSLAQYPTGGADQLDLVILKSQLLSFYRLKGYSPLPEFQFCGDLSEDADSSVHVSGEGSDDHIGSVCKDDSKSLEISQAQRPYYYKRKHNLKDGVYSSKKEKWDSVEDEVGAADGKMVSPSSAKRRKGPNHFSDESVPSEGVKTISLAKISNTTSASVPKPSFKIGECIRRAASHMTGSPSMLKSSSQKFDGSSDVYDSPLLEQSDDTESNRLVAPVETHSSVDELLSQLQSAARDPLQRDGCLDVFFSFFSEFRNSVVVVDQHDKLGKRRKVFHSAGDTETFEFVDMNDTYWTDRVIQNGSEEQPPPTTRKSRKRENLFVPVSLDNKQTQRSTVRNKRHISDGNDYNNVPPDTKPIGYVDEKAPAELVMHFPVVDSVPSEMKLNKMFKCFGPLKESETEVDRNTNRARVVFRHCSDAQTAYGSASKFNIFGSLLVNYQLNYTISVPFKSEPLPMTHGEEDETVFLQY
ncbi:unnamed protein product [Linum tenue]|uniref:PWWP domain-containing protein n=1 Tax=Linum tenue TaxID=586396 RepID=A0AAV0JRZ8_9ROSI|nr:unnamed protein product [Linum tenue]